MKNKLKTLTIIIPAFNEALVIKSVLKSLPKKIIGIARIKIILIDDGSSDKTSQIARSVPGIKVLRHRINLGVGGATMTGLEAAKILQADVAVTIDADGQHNPAEIAKIIKPILNGNADIVIGNRFLKAQKIPQIRIIFNQLANILTNWLYQTKIGDSQSGFRAYSRQALEKINIEVNGFEFCSEILGQAKRLNLIISEVPISVRYSDYSLSKGQGFANSFTMGFNLIFKAFRRIS